MTFLLKVEIGNAYGDALNYCRVIMPAFAPFLNFFRRGKVLAYTPFLIKTASTIEFGVTCCNTHALPFHSCTSMPKFRSLDKVDRKLLNLLQKDNQIPTRELADRVHVSQPTCLRRVRELREAGIISADVALVDPFALGYGMMAFLEVSLTNQSDEQMKEFESRMNREAEVLQCYFVSGDYDYFLVVHVLDMDAYYQFVRRAISGSGNVRHFQSRFPMKRAKFVTRVAFDEKAVAVQVKMEK